jgi:hypothetical protein
MGIKSKKSQKLFTKSQQVGRIVAAVAATVVTAGALAPAAGGAVGAGGAAVGTTATTTGGLVVSKLAVLKAMGGVGLTKLKDFFMKSGVAGTAAATLAQQVMDGQRPVPEGMYFPEAERSQASMFGGLNLNSPIVMISAMALIGGVAYMSSQTGGKRRRR